MPGGWRRRACRSSGRSPRFSLAPAAPPRDWPTFSGSSRNSPRRLWPRSRRPPPWRQSYRRCLPRPVRRHRRLLHRCQQRRLPRRLAHQEQRHLPRRCRRLPRPGPRPMRQPPRQEPPHRKALSSSQRLCLLVEHRPPQRRSCLLRHQRPPSFSLPLLPRLRWRRFRTCRARCAPPSSPRGPARHCRHRLLPPDRMSPVYHPCKAHG